MYQISRDDLLSAIRDLNHSHSIVAPVEANQKFNLKHFPPGTWQKENWYYSPIRTPQPLKSFYYPPVDKVAEYPEKEDDQNKYEPYIIIGPKACDVHALKIIDKVYLEGDYPDPGYVRARTDNIIISSDCLDSGDYCACTLLNCKPYAEDNFDLNLSQVDETFCLEIGSVKGEKLFNEFFKNAQKLSQSIRKSRDANRENMIEKVQKVNREFQYFQSHQEAIQRHLKSGEWYDLAKTCVECGTCTQICPTCYCFLLFDQPVEDKYERIKVWDSCFFAGYSRMAGGLTPRLSLADRFKNRFYHKFDSFVTNYGVEACTGCGRCSEGCMGDIDLRKVLLELEKRVVLKENINIP